MVKNLPAMQEMQKMQVLSLGREDPLEESMVTHSTILTWRLPWTEELNLYYSWVCYFGPFTIQSVRLGQCKAELGSRTRL